MVGYRILRGQSIITPGSACPACHHPLAWYDNIPLLSYLLLGGRCRSCKSPISWLYPFIEIITLISLSALYFLVPAHYWFAYAIFFSALIVTIRTDLEMMLISRYVTLLLIPFGWIFAALGWLPLSLFESFIGSITGYLILFITAYCFWRVTGREGMGQGDLELLAFIGAFIGPWGCWPTLMIASTVGALCGLAYMIIHKQKKTIAIAFGPFLALGAMIFVLFSKSLLLFFPT